MRVVAVGSLSVIFLCACVGMAFAADYSNDSNSIDINYTGAAPTSPSSDEGTSPPEDGTSSGGSSGSGSGIEGLSDVTIPVTISTTNDTGGGQTNGSQGGTVQSGNGSGTSGQGTLGGTPSAQEILNTLQGNQAVVFGEAGNGSGGAGGDAFGTLTLSGKKVRAALAARGVSEIILGSALGRKFLTRGDATIAAASALLQNQALEEVVLSLDTINLTYTAEGRLFAVFPIHYPLKLTIQPNGTTQETRVFITFPWYSFFLQTYVSKNALAGYVDAAVTATVAQNLEGVDAKSRLLIAVTDVLQSRLIH